MLDQVSVRTRLRDVTAEIHEALHRAEAFAAIAAGTLTRAGYGEVLVMLGLYHRSLAAVCGRGARGLGLEALAEMHQARIAALEDDMDFLGVARRGDNAPAEGIGAFAMGCLYTVQGSTLGGKVIHRQLDYLLADERGRSFFKGSGEDGRLWQGLCAALERQGPSAALEEGALYAFARFQDLLP